jgi:hypothetical protein
MIPFINRPANKEELSLLKSKMISLAQKPDKNGCNTLPGDGFAKALAEVCGLDYVNNYASFDAKYKVGNLVRGIEIKYKEHDPYKHTSIRDYDHLYIELCNGTSKVWKYIREKTGIKRTVFPSPPSDATAKIVGDVMLEYCWNRFATFAKNIDLQNSKAVIGHVIEGKEEMCQIFTLPLNVFPRPDSLRWTFGSDEQDPEDNPTIHAYNGKDRVIEWSWLNNGQAKFFPRTNECEFISTPFKTNIDVSKKFRERCDQLGVRKFLMTVMTANNLSARTREQCIQVASRRPKEFAAEFTDLFNRAYPKLSLT